MNKKIAVVLFATLLLSSMLVPIIGVSALTPIEVVLLDDGFEPTPWNDNWDDWVNSTGYPSQWWVTYNVPVAARVHSGTKAACASNNTALKPGEFDGLFVSNAMDTSDAPAIYVSFWYQRSNTDPNSFNLTFWDGNQWIFMDKINEGPFYPEWVQYENTFHDPTFFINDFQLAFNATLGETEIVRVDDVYVSKIMGYRFDLSTYTVGRGSVTPDIEGPYDEDTVVELTAEPDLGWSFDHWENDLTGNTNPDTITMDNDKTVTAVFTKDEGILLALAKTSYDYGETIISQITRGTANGEVMIQFALGATVRWADQTTLDSSGEINYPLKIPSDWPQGTYTIYVKDIESDTTYSRTVTIPTPPPPPKPPSGGGGGGVSVMLPTVLQILRFSPEEAAEVLEDFSARSVARKLATVENMTHVALIMEYFDPDYAKDVLAEMDHELATSLLHTMTNETAVPVLLEMDQTNSELLKAFIEYDFNSSVALIEEAVKTKIAGLNETERKEQLALLSAALGSLDVETLVETLIAIAKLPDTPTMVAYIFNSMSLDTVINVVSSWIDDYTEELPVLGMVMESLDTETLNDLYRGITDQERETILPHLSAATIARVSTTTTFQVTDLTVSPSVAEPGDPVTITYEITNTGDSADSYVMSLKIDNMVEEIDEGFLYADESVTIQHIVQRSPEDTYTVTVNGASSSFEVVEPTPPPEPADLQVTGAEAVPSMVNRGEDVSIYATVTNAGEETGSETFTLRLDGSELESKEASDLLGGYETTLIFTVTMEFEAGVYEFTIGGKSVTVEVQAQEGRFPWFTLVAVLVILGAIAVYLYNQRRQSAEISSPIDI